MEEKYIEKIISNEQSTKSAHKRIDDAEARIDELEKTYAIMQKMDYRIGRMEDSVAKTQNTNEKSKKWDKFLDYIFYAIVGAIIALVLAKFGF